MDKTNTKYIIEIDHKEIGSSYRDKYVSLQG